MESEIIEEELDIQVIADDEIVTKEADDNE